MIAGRNDPCPCGSGRKFKKCHGASEGDFPPSAVASPAAARATALKACDMALAQRLERHARRRHGPHWMDDVLVTEVLGTDDLGDDDLADDELPIAVPWLLYCRRADGDSTLAEDWRRGQQRLSPDEHLLIDAYGDAWVSIWEVTEVQPGIGSRLTDALTGAERFVHDVSSSTMLRQFDSILALVLTCDGVSFFGGVHGSPLPPSFASVAVREARRLCRVRTRPVKAARLRDPTVQLELVALWSLVVGMMLRQPPPMMQNTDGDPFVLTRDDFVVLGALEDVVSSIARLPGVLAPEEEGTDLSFVVTKAGNAVHRSWDNTITGRIVLSKGRLTTETNSTRRADALRAALEAGLAGLVEFRVRTEENTAQLMELARASGGSATSRPQDDLPPDAVVALREFREQHLRDWLESPIPALGDLTPREAARVPPARERLASLLKEMQQTENSLPPAQRVDLRPLRDELGFG